MIAWTVDPYEDGSGDPYEDRRARCLALARSSLAGYSNAPGRMSDADAIHALTDEICGPCEPDGSCSWTYWQ